MPYRFSSSAPYTRTRDISLRYKNNAQEQKLSSCSVSFLMRLTQSPDGTKCPPNACYSPKDFSLCPYLSLRKYLFSNSIAPSCRLPPNRRRGADGVPDQQVSARWSPLGSLLPVGCGKTNRARLSAPSHLGRQNCCPKGGAVHLVRQTPTCIQSRGILFQVMFAQRWALRGNPQR